MAIGNSFGQRISQGIQGNFTGKSTGAYLVSADANGTMQWQDLATFTEAIQDIVGGFTAASARIIPTYNDAGNAISFDLGINSITGNYLAQIAALTIKGNPTNAFANQADITFSVDGGVLSRSGTALVTALINSSNIAAGAVSYGKIQNVAANSLVGNLSGSAAAPTDISISSLRNALNSSTIVTATAQTISPGNRYIPNNIAEVVFSLPTTSAVGDSFNITGYGSGGWRMNQTVAGQTQTMTGISTTAGITSANIGTIRSGNGQPYSAASWICVSASPIIWLVVPEIGDAFRIDE